MHVVCGLSVHCIIIYSYQLSRMHTINALKSLTTTTIIIITFKIGVRISKFLTQDLRFHYIILKLSCSSVLEHYLTTTYMDRNMACTVHIN